METLHIKHTKLPDEGVAAKRGWAKVWDWTKKTAAAGATKMVEFAAQGIGTALGAAILGRFLGPVGAAVGGFLGGVLGRRRPAAA
jgi:hypothetical protein